MKVVLTIAGSDSCGGAGVQQDLKVFQACGVYGATAVTAVTAQNTRGVRRVFHVPAQFVSQQIDAVAEDLPVAAVKTGMLGRAQVVEAVAERIRRRELPNLVVDPVIAAKDGTRLLSARGVEVLKRRLLPQALAVTPNVPEAQILSGVEITDEESLRAAARAIGNLGVRAVVIKGGHLPGDPVDTLYFEGEFHTFPGPRLEGSPVHGTGCLYASFLAAHVARGSTLPEACAAAKAGVEQAIRGAQALGKGSRVVVFPPAE